MNPDRVRVWIARLAAPLAFFFAATVLIVLVQRALESDAGEAVATGTENIDTGATTTTASADGTTTERGRCARRFYRVRAGDTLESIAARCETDVATLLDLNPEIDPLALSPGQRIRVRGQPQT